MAKKHKNELKKFPEPIRDAINYVSSQTRLDDRKAEGMKVKKKKQVKKVCCHWVEVKDIRSSYGRKRLVPSFREMYPNEPGYKAGYVKCTTCGAVFYPNITDKQLDVLKEAYSIINGSLALLPTLNISDKDATVALQARAYMRKFNTLYKTAVQDLSDDIVEDTKTYENAFRDHLHHKSVIGI
jgi:hypothetical protein